ncbi:hypothetical protein Pmar_PMAR029021 [Perkinsus marinus ATCC 50983]|uniref:Uncharacterized protein n=1 Tax=Perkinsus marinus (strain ATCC 50983 / TXsc) TaxID=423536 RepID=C5L6A5_PERM5|nr:hypothetical protein Pmar_PMAR029021 [Perkinsus marinus ATCC 50983]EER07732.1 hypothetical protein Pmar_PMAR029021 [Perkinsus marinus ATCC 50983]|eukprot:XP_002775916.1 hypothetical protein Pmar_PMAR029021 [Perkinsus marinus ATCC 50983]
MPANTCFTVRRVALADLSVEEPYRRPQNRADQGWWVAALSKMLFTLIGVGGVVMYQFRKRNKYGAGRTDSLEEIDECAVDWPTRCIVRYIVVKSYTQRGLWSKTVITFLASIHHQLRIAVALTVFLRPSGSFYAHNRFTEGTEGFPPIVSAGIFPMTRGGRAPSKTRRRQSHVSFGTAKRTRVIHYSPSLVPSEVPASPPLQHMSAEQQRAYKAGEVVVKEEPEDDVKISPLGSRRRSRRRSIPGRSSPHRTHVQALHPAQEGGHTRSGRRVQRPKFFSPDGEMVPSDTNKYVIVLSDSESD